MIFTSPPHYFHKKRFCAFNFAKLTFNDETQTLKRRWIRISVVWTWECEQCSENSLKEVEYLLSVERYEHVWSWARVATGRGRLGSSSGKKAQECQICKRYLASLQLGTRGTDLRPLQRNILPITDAILSLGRISSITALNSASSMFSVPMQTGQISFTRSYLGFPVPFLTLFSLFGVPFQFLLAEFFPSLSSSSPDPPWNFLLHLSENKHFSFLEFSLHCSHFSCSQH